MTDRLYRHSVTHPGPGEWTVIVASGAAVRRGLLGVALATVGSPEHTLCVIGRADHERARPQLGDRCDHVLVQPSSIELGGALLVALALVQRWDPDAFVTTIVLAADDDEPDPVFACDNIDYLLELGRGASPALVDMLDAFASLVDTDDEDAGFEAVFSFAPYVDIRELFPRRQHSLAAFAFAS